RRRRRSLPNVIRDLFRSGIARLVVGGLAFFIRRLCSLGRNRDRGRCGGCCPRGFGLRLLRIRRFARLLRSRRLLHLIGSVLLVIFLVAVIVVVFRASLGRIVGRGTDATLRDVL